METKSEIQNLLDVLQSEREALLEGKLGALPTIATQKEELMSVISKAELSEREIRAFKDIAARNQTLLRATMRGIRSVADRLEILRGGGTLNTYNETGQRQSLTNTATKRLERRA